MLDRSELFDSELVARLTRREIPGPPSPHPYRGIHRSPRRGASLEFSEHAEYSPGEDLRNLDWKVYGRTDRFFVKRYEDERHQRAVFLVDASASMSYGGLDGGTRASKYHLAARAAVALAACLTHQGDAVGLQLAGAEAAFLPPRGGPGHLEALIELLGRAVPRGLARLSAAGKLVAERLGRGAAVFVLSDFLDEDEEGLEALRLLKALGISPRAVQVLHADELDLPFENTTRFLDLEESGSLVLDPVAVRRAYREEVAAFVDRVRAAAESLGAPHAFVATGSDPAPALAGLLRTLDLERG
ncbi:MAG: DUF58 domain-containing protein [Deltaproteobacteria bacterium]|nr:DUF58 domain-containing protein [Deltaproteobacteria bacterium]